MEQHRAPRRRAAVLALIVALPALIHAFAYNEAIQRQRIDTLLSLYPILSNASAPAIKIGVLSDSADQLAAMQASGILPNDTVVLQDAPGNSGEGTAMMQLIHEMFPTAKLYFATAWLSPTSFANNIRALKNAGCDVIVDDVSWSDTPQFSDGDLVKAIEDVTASGALYFSAAGNAGNLLKRTAAMVWRGDFTPGSSFTINSKSYYLHLWNGVSANANAILNTASSSRFIGLQWSEPWGNAVVDYDLFVLRSGSLIASSTQTQGSYLYPFEALSVAHQFNDLIVVGSISNAASNVREMVIYGFGTTFLNFGTTGSITNQGCGSKTFAVAAVDQAQRTSGSFMSTDTIEAFSSDGNCRIYYDSSGNALTPGLKNIASGGGITRNKPDLAGTDGCTNNVTGFNPFYGTSAAAPNAAAVAALLVALANRSHYRTLNFTFWQDILCAGTLDITGAGRDRDSGCGILMGDTAASALVSAFSTPSPSPSPSRPPTPAPAPPTASPHLSSPSPTPQSMMRLTTNFSGDFTNGSTCAETISDPSFTGNMEQQLAHDLNVYSVYVTSIWCASIHFTIQAYGFESEIQSASANLPTALNSSLSTIGADLTAVTSNSSQTLDPVLNETTCTCRQVRQVACMHVVNYSTNELSSCLMESTCDSYACDLVVYDSLCTIQNKLTPVALGPTSATEPFNCALVPGNIVGFKNLL